MQFHCRPFSLRFLGWTHEDPATIKHKPTGRSETGTQPQRRLSTCGGQLPGCQLRPLLNRLQIMESSWTQI